MRTHSSRRSGFTLVELLIAAAVSILLMVILTEAFKAGLEMFRKMRAQGNLMTKLREASTTIRTDLAAPHFPNYKDPNLPYLSQQDLTSATWTPPTDGYFRIWQGPEPENILNNVPPYAFNNPFVFEGLDPEGIMYCRCTNQGMQFTVLLGGAAGSDDMFRTLEGPHGNSGFPALWIQPAYYRDGLSFSSKWAQVSYFMRSTGQFTKTTPYNPRSAANQQQGGVPLFDLCRRVQLLMPLVSAQLDGTNPPSNLITNSNQNPDLSADINNALLVREGWNTSFSANVPPSVDQPQYRFGQFGTPAGFPYKIPDNLGLPNPMVRRRPPAIGDPGEYDPPQFLNRRGDDVLLSDVLSFEIKAVWAYPTGNNIFTTGPSQGGPLAFQPFPANDWALPGIGPYPNADAPFDFLPMPKWGNPLPNPFINPSNPSFVIVPNQLSYRVFDTWSRAPGTGYSQLINGNPAWSVNGTPFTVPLKIRIKTLQIRIRIWDRKSEQAREITIVQDV